MHPILISAFLHHMKNMPNTSDKPYIFCYSLKNYCGKNENRKAYIKQVIEQKYNILQRGCVEASVH